MNIYDLLENKELLKKRLKELNIDQLTEIIEKQTNYNMKLKEELKNIQEEQ